MLQLNTSILDLGQKPVLLDSGCRRSNTAIMRYQAVQQAISTMNERYMEQLTLPEIADSAQLSPFHFNRIFRSMIGISPSVFLAALRMKEAKKLLLSTKDSVTSICFDVGYTSLGTFTFRFTLLVGLPPTHFRLLAQEEMMQTNLGDLHGALEYAQQSQPFAYEGGIRGSIYTSEPFKGLIFIGLFSSPLPQSRPEACCILTSTGRYYIPPVPDGHYYLFSAAMDQSQDFLSILAQGPRLHGGRETRPIEIRNGRATEERDIFLAQPSWADPPIVIAFPWLFMQYFQQYRGLAMQMS